MELKKRLLVIGAHNDDPEFCAGGLCALLKEQGWDIRFICVSHKRRWSKKQEGSEVERTYRDPEAMARYLEQDMRSAEILGAEKMHLIPPDNTLGFCAYDEKAIRSLIDEIEDFEPDIALVHWLKDNHFEHVESAKMAMTALSYSKVDCEVHAFEAGPWQSSVYFLPDFTVDITHVMDPLNESMMVYDQITAKGENLVREKEALARLRGHMSGFRYGESYKILRFPCGNDPEMILPKLLGEKYRWGGSRQYMWGNQYMF